jgi:N-methylhydantoinase B
VSHPATSGIYGGYPSSTVQFSIQRDSNIRELHKRGITPQSIEEIEGELERFGELSLTHMGRDDVYFFTSTGGGGYGDPLERDPDLVVNDFRNFLVTRQAAREIYGVHVQEDGRSADPEETAALRLRIRTRRIGKPPVESRLEGASKKARLNEYLCLVERNGEERIACRCGFSLSRSDDNYKVHALRKDFPIGAAGPHVDPSPLAPRKTFAWREFYCPACALLLTTEVALEEDPVLWELNPKV